MKNKFIYNPTFLILSLIAVNIVSYFVFARIDLTSNKKYSLSPVSKNMIKKVDKDVSVTLFMSEGLSQDKMKMGREFKHLLKEYKTLSNKSFTITTITPDNDSREILALEAGIHPFSQESMERDMVKIQKIYFGAVIQIGNKKSVIPLISQHTPLEYEVTRMLKEACDTTKPNIGFLLGHNEMLRDKITQIRHELFRNARLESLYIDQFTDLNRYKVICIMGPRDSFSKEEIKRLQEYLKQGGRLYIALNHAVGQITASQNNGFINRVGLEDMLENFGLKINYDFVIDSYCGRIRVSQGPFFLYQSEVSFPYMPTIQKFSSHVITNGLNAISLLFASRMTHVKTTSAYTFTPLAKTSPTSGVQEVPVFFDIQKTWTRHDFNRPNNVVAALLNNEDDKSAIIVISNASFMEDNDYDALRLDNIRFAINSIEWLADDSGLIKLRNKYIVNQTLEPVSNSYRTFLKYFNFFLPIVIILLIGLFQYRQYKLKRLRRSQSGYID